MKNYQYRLTYNADLGHVEYLLAGKGKFGNLGIYPHSSSLEKRSIYYIYIELCTFFNKHIYVDMNLISRFGLEKETMKK